MALKRIALIAATIVTGLMAALSFWDIAAPPATTFEQRIPIEKPIVIDTIVTVSWMVLFGHFLHRVLTGRWRWWRSTRG